MPDKIIIIIFAIVFSACIYDTANADIVCAGIPADYTQVEYLTSSGKEYISTNVYFDITKDFRVIGDVINRDASKRAMILGNYYGNVTSFSIEFGGNSNNKPGYFRNFIEVYIGNNQWPQTSYFAPSAQPVNTLIKYDTNYSATNRTISNNLTYNGSTITYSFNTITYTGTAEYPLRFFLDYRGSSSAVANPISVGRTQMYKDGALAGDFVPAKRTSDNVLGMYDIVTRTFLTNSGSGSFTAGPTVACSGTTISLTWDGVSTAPTSCTYGSTFVPPTPAARPGYRFTGWKVKTINP